ncbi:MAG: lptC [Chitinophagaceae bacterium]|nr:lptC [Chitinophagaceae bacterium]
MISHLNIKFITAALFAGCFFIYGCENDIRQVRDLGVKTTNVEEAVNIQSIMSQDGKLRAKLYSPLMLRYPTDTVKIEFPKSLRVEFFDSSNKIESRLFAKYGRYLENSSKVFLRDSVLVFNVHGDTLKTNELYWDQASQMFYTDKQVKVIRPDITINAIGFRANQDLKNMTFFKAFNSTALMADSTVP